MPASPVISDEEAPVAKVGKRPRVDPGVRWRDADAEDVGVFPRRRDAAVACHRVRVRSGLGGTGRAIVPAPRQARREEARSGEPDGATQRMPGGTAHPITLDAAQAMRKRVPPRMGAR